MYIYSYVNIKTLMMCYMCVFVFMSMYIFIYISIHNYVYINLCWQILLRELLSNALALSAYRLIFSLQMLST